MTGESHVTEDGGVNVVDDLEVQIVDDEPHKEPEPEKVEAEPESKEKPEATEAAEGDPEDDGEGYGKKVRARIQREQKLKQEARAEARAERERAEKAVKEAEDLRKKLREAETARSHGSIDAKIAEVKAKLRQAKVDMDLDAEIEAQAELADLTAKRNSTPPPVTEEPVKPAAVAERAATVGKLVGEWRRRNPWTREPKHQAVMDEALDVNRELVDEGFDDADPEFYKELDKRLAERIDIPKQEKQRTPVESAQPSIPSGGSKNVVTLTRADLSNMRRFGLDPENKEHLKRWALSKQEAAK